MALIRINVTQKNIEDAKTLCANRNNPRSLNCVITLAFKDAGFPKARTVPGMCFYDGPNTQTILPVEATTLINNFDNYRPISPISFDVEIPEKE